MDEFGCSVLLLLLVKMGIESMGWQIFIYRLKQRLIAKILSFSSGYSRYSTILGRAICGHDESLGGL
jgi:hypothetical protein